MHGWVPYWFETPTDYLCRPAFSLAQVDYQDEMKIRNPIQALTLTATPWKQPVGSTFQSK